MKHKDCKIDDYFNDARNGAFAKVEYCLKNCSLDCLHPNSKLSLNDRLSLPPYLFAAIQEKLSNDAYDRGYKDCYKHNEKAIEKLEDHDSL